MEGILDCIALAHTFPRADWTLHVCIYQDYGDACSKVFVEMHIMEDELVLVPFPPSPSLRARRFNANTRHRRRDRQERSLSISPRRKRLSKSIGPSRLRSELNGTNMRSEKAERTCEEASGRRVGVAKFLRIARMPRIFKVDRGIDKKKMF